MQVTLQLHEVLGDQDAFTVASIEVETVVETLVFHFIYMVATIGGDLGLFLGFSFLRCLNSAFRIFISRLNQNKSARNNQRNVKDKNAT